MTDAGRAALAELARRPLRGEGGAGQGARRTGRHAAGPTPKCGRTRLGGRRSSVAGTVAAVAEALGVTRWHVSLSHDGGVAAATVIAEAGR